MKMFFRILFSMITGRYWKIWWALENCKEFLCGNGGNALTICQAVTWVDVCDVHTVEKACRLVRQEIHPYPYLCMYLEAQGLLPAGYEDLLDSADRCLKDPLYFHLRDQWLNDLIIKLRKEGV